MARTSFVLIDSLLKNQGGHQFLYSVPFCLEMAKRGADVVVVGNKHADSVCLALPGFLPYFSDIISNILKNKGFPDLLGIIKSTKLLSYEFETFFEKEGYLQAKRETYFFLASPYIFELLAFALFLKRRSREIISTKHKFAIGFNLLCKRIHWWENLILFVLYRYVFNYLIKNIPENRFVFFSSDAATAAEYKALIRKNVNFIPSPVANDFSLKSNTAKRLTENKTVVAYMGGARLDKGFDSFVGHLDFLLKNSWFEANCQFLVHLYISDLQPEKDRQAVSGYVQKVRDLAAKHSCVKLIEGILSCGEYSSIFSNSDIIILSHDSRLFKTAVPGTFKDTLVFARVPVVVSGGGMADALKKYGLEELIFNVNDHASLAAILKKVTANKGIYLSRMEKISAETRKLFSVATLVDKLMCFYGNDE